MAHERIKPEFLFDEEKINKLKQIAPECFEDGKINFETLRQNLGDWAQDEEDNELEHFGLFWPGKKEARKLATIPPEGTLEPVFGEGLKSDGTPDTDGQNVSKNIFIEGENMEVLKILQKSYANKIKMIYIDPPYNTGNDFVYDDDFTEPLQEYLRRTGQVDEEGKPLTTNKKSDGRFHSKWLSMMYPRLRLAHNLLKEDGVIFVSIDDNEVHNLRAIMNEIYGEENFVSNLVWQSRTSISNDQEISTNHNHTLVYSKNRDDLYFTGLELNIDEYSNPDEDERGPWKLVPIDANKPGGETFYGIVNPNNDQEYFPPNGRSWAINKDSYQKLFDDGRIKFGMNNDSSPKKKLFLRERIEKGDSKTPSSILTEYGTTKTGTTELMELFDKKKVFTYPKPTKLLLQFFKFSLSEKDIVLDFFAGSCSTGDALYKLNLEKNEDNKFILVSMPEILDKNKKEHKAAYEFCESKNFPLILTEVSKERLRRSHKKILSNDGFKVFKLNNSNYKKWEDIQETDVDQLELAIDNFSNSPLREDWSKPKLLTEIMLLEGFPLDSVQTVLQIGENNITKVDSEMVPNTLLICLDEAIQENLIEELKLDSQSIFICLDSAISNQNKLRLSDKGLIKTI